MIIRRLGLSAVISLLKMIAVLVAASFLGNWFLIELRKAHALQKPWYAPYMTWPGLLILIALFIPIVIKFYIE
jgi:hypothetical protein